ncbi:MAG: anti-sigma factor [Pyrinomonadaceae bacterium]|nr:anti-sigma factor [Pyrinomonadaceae bacterium]
MNKEIQESLIDLHLQRAVFGLDADEKQTFESLLADAGVGLDDSFDLAAAAVGLIDLQIDEPLPPHLQARVIASADEYFASTAAENETVDEDDFQKVLTFEPKRSWSWLGWAFAAVACVALAANIWVTRIAPAEVAGPTKTPEKTPVKLTPEQELAQLLASQASLVKANFGVGNVKELKDVGGDVVWSDEKQTGFMRLRGLPVNDKTKETYQLWIFDKTQDKATPIDGGTFDVDKNGEVIVPIDAKLKALGPELFAITIEKPGGVVVSKREKIAALAKVETQSKTNT